MFWIFVLLRLLSTFLAEDAYVCRHCGSVIIPIDSVFNKQSPLAVEYFKENLKSKNGSNVEVLVQKFINPEGIPLYLLAAKEAKVFELGKRTYKDSFFEGFTHTTTFCGKCGRQVGWLYEPRPSACLKSDREEVCHRLYDAGVFYGVMRSEIVSKDYVDSLIVYKQEL